VSNPLLSKQHLPQFADIKAEHVLPAIEHALDNAWQQINQLEQSSDSATWVNFGSILQSIDIELDHIWSSVSHLNSVMDSPELREAYQAGKEKLTEFHTALGQNEAIYKGYKLIAASDDFTELTAAQQKVVSNAIRDFKLSGAELNTEDKQQFADIVQQLSSKQTAFEQNLLDATQHWHLLVTDKTELSGLPEYAIELAKTTAHQHDQQGYRFGLDIPSYIAVMKYADSASLREKIYRAYATRASLEALILLVKPKLGSIMNLLLMRS